MNDLAGQFDDTDDEDFDDAAVEVIDLGDFDDLEAEDDAEVLEEGQTPVGVIELYPTRAEISDRLDRFVTNNLQGFSRAYVQQLIDGGNVLVDGLMRRRTFKVTPGQVVKVNIPAPAPFDLMPEDIPLDILYEDDDVIVLNKPAGLVVHPAPGHLSGTLVNALLHHAPEMAISGTNRPGIVHRLDKDTSGVMVIAKTDRAKNTLVDQWSRRAVNKQYIALVARRVEDEEATIDVPIVRDVAQRKRMAVSANGRASVTHFSVRERFGDIATLLDIDLETGRTHQIRVHLAYIGHPIVGDSLYNRATGPVGGAESLAPRQWLHAAKLSFKLPDGKKMTFDAPVPADLEAALERLRTEYFD